MKYSNLVEYDGHGHGQFPDCHICSIFNIDETGLTCNDLN